MNPQEFTAEGLNHRTDFTVPSADYSVSPEKISAPLLMECAGIDPRFKGTLRSFPGFASLGINDSYMLESGLAAGPLLVGPGITHEDASGNPDWQHWQMKLPKGSSNPIKLFKYIEFKRDVTSSDVISGFVIALPYTGPLNPAGVANVNKAGLPYWHGTGFDDELTPYVLAFLYWDTLYYTTPRNFSKGPGWRIRILSPQKGYYDLLDGSTTGTETVFVEFFGALDVSCWAQFGYIAGNMNFTDNTAADRNDWDGYQSFGCSSTLSTFDGYDYTQGPAVLYYDNARKYVRVREMGPQILASQTPTFLDAADVTPPIDTPGELVIQTGGTAATNGLINSLGSPAVCTVAVSFFNNTTNLRSDMQLDRTVILPADTRLYLVGRASLHEDLWNNFDTIELWRSPIGQPGVLYKENSFALGTLPAYDADKDEDASHRSFLITYGLGSTTTQTAEAAIQADYTPGTNYRYDFVSAGVSTYGLMMQPMYDGVWEFTAKPPHDGNKLLVHQDTCFMVNGLVYNSNTPYVRPRMRWSSLIIPRPENFADTDNNYFPDEEVGLVYGICRAGDMYFVPGTRCTLSFRRNGDRLAFSNVGENLAPVSRFAYTVGGNRYFVLTKEGIYVVDANDGSVQPMEALNHELLADERWGRELLMNFDQMIPSIGLEYDESGDVLIVRNLNRSEAVLVSMKTGFVTKVHDFPWTLSTQGQSPSHTADGTAWSEGERVSKAFFVGEQSLTQGQNVNDPYFDIFYIDFAPDRPVSSSTYYYSQRPVTMHGDPGVVEFNGSPSFGRVEGSLLSGDIYEVLTESGGESKFKIDVELGGQADLMLDRLQRKLLGGFVHLFSEDGETHVRRQIHWIEADADTRATFVLYPALSAAEITALDGGRYAVCPVVVRVIPPIIQSNGNMANVSSGSILMDVLAVRSAKPVAGVTWVNVADAVNMQMFAVGYDRESRDLAVADSYGGYGTQDVAFSLGTDDVTGNYIVAFPSPPPPGRFKEVERTRVTPSRYESETAFGLRFNTTTGCVGVEAYPTATLLELHSLKIAVNIQPGNRRSR